jgi:hypothetical protein
VKFFASNQGNIAQIAGVYNVKIKLAAGAYFLYPGQVCWVDGGLGQDPSSPKTIAFQLGIGGYYQIITVNHEIEYFGGQSPKTKTVVEASWIGYGVKKSEQKAAFFRTGLVPKGAKAAACNSTLPERASGGIVNYSSSQYRNAKALGQKDPVANVPQGSPTGGSTGKKEPKKIVPTAKRNDTVRTNVLNLGALATGGQQVGPESAKVTNVTITNKQIKIEGHWMTTDGESKQYYSDMETRFKQGNIAFQVHSMDNLYVAWQATAKATIPSMVPGNPPTEIDLTLYYDQDNNHILTTQGAPVNQMIYKNSSVKTIITFSTIPESDFQKSIKK